MNNLDSWPIEFKRIATAIAFSPRAEANLFESSRIAMKFDATLLLIHVGEKSEENEAKIMSLVDKVGFDKQKIEISWQVGKPVDAILEACKQFDVDLLIAGANQSENLIQYYKGSIARKLCRKAQCSLLLLTNPQVNSKICEKIVVNGLNHPKTKDTIKTAFYFANALGSKQLFVLEEMNSKLVKSKDQDDLSLAKAQRNRQNIKRQEHLRLESILSEIPENQEIEVFEKCVFGKKGYSIGHFAQSKKMDLVVLNSPDSKLGFLDRIFTHDLEYVLSDMPSDILIVHSTKKTSIV